MNYKAIALALSSLMLVITGTMILPLTVALYFGEFGLVKSFRNAIVISGLSFGLLAGIFIYYRRHKPNANFSLQVREGLLVVPLAWLAVTSISAIPFVTSGYVPSYIDAFFETMSGYTTTGSSILVDIEALPNSLLFWRSMTHWLGGMGFIVLTVALFPLLGIGGMQLMRAEAPGPEVDRLTYRISHTAKILWLTYGLLTLLQIVLLSISGMSLFDSVIHSFGTMATGGFSNKNLSVGAFHSPAQIWIITIFMLLAGTNFITYFHLIQGRFKKIWINTELKVYYSIVIIASLGISLVLLANRVYGSWGEALMHGSFQVASILTTTGYATTNYDLWPEGSKAILLLLMFVGGCAGSTAGGVKVIRICALVKKGVLEMRYVFNPRGFYRIFINRQSMNSLAIARLLGFLVLYLLLLLLSTLVLAMFGSDLLSSFSASLAILGNIGPGFAAVGPAMNYSELHDFVKIFLSIVMLIGRLEIYTFLVILMPRFWRNF